MIFKNIKKILVIIIMFLTIRELQAQDFSIEAVTLVYNKGTNIFSAKGNVKIYFADVDVQTGQLSVESVTRCIKINKIKKVKAIINMYLSGNLRQVSDFYKLKKKLNCYLIEDACHALGAKYRLIGDVLSVSAAFLTENEEVIVKNRVYEYVDYGDSLGLYTLSNHPNIKPSTYSRISIRPKLKLPLGENFYFQSQTI